MANYLAQFQTIKNSCDHIVIAGESQFASVKMDSYCSFTFPNPSLDRALFFCFFPDCKYYNFSSDLGR